MPLRGYVLLMAGALIVACGSRSTPGDRILIDDRSVGCFHDQTLHYEWRRDGEAFVREGGRVVPTRVEAIRNLVMSSRSEPKDLIRQLGFTPERLAAHRTVVRMLMTSAAWRQQHDDAASLSPEHEAQVAYDRFIPLIRSRLVPPFNGSTTSHEFSAVLPGSPMISVQSHGGMPWMLPWKITMGSESWEVADPAISLAMLELADPGGPSAPLLDGRAYSREGLWEDAMVWASQVGPAAVTR